MCINNDAVLFPFIVKTNQIQKNYKNYKRRILPIIFPSPSTFQIIKYSSRYKAHHFESNGTVPYSENITRDSVGKLFAQQQQRDYNTRITR